MNLVKKIFCNVVMLFVLLLITGSCGGNSSGSKSVFPGDTSSELAIREFPASGVSIGQHTKLVFSFNNPVDITSVVLGGTMYNDSNGGAWSSVTYTNDTLTVKPAARWTTGVDRTITIDAVNALGDTVSFAYTYTVINQVIYVRPDGADYNPGSATQPKKTIQAALKQAVESDQVTEIHVAEGTYAADYQQGTGIRLKDGIMIFGGYSPTDWSVRDTALYETVIQDHSMAGSINSPVIFGEDIKEFAQVDGFTIKAGTGKESSAVIIQTSSALLSNNRLVLGKSFDKNYGIYNEGLISPLIENNTLEGTDSKNMKGIYNNEANSRIIGNTITLWNNTGIIDIYGIYSTKIINAPEVGPIISGNRITLYNYSNTGYSIYCENTPVTVSSNHVTMSCSGSYGLYLKGTSFALVNNVMDCISSDYIYFIYSSYEEDNNGYILNNTFVGDEINNNTSILLYFKRAYVDSEYKYNILDITVRNNILSGIQSITNYSTLRSTPLVFTYNNIDSTTISDYSDLHNMPLAVLFADKEAQDYRLTEGTATSIAEDGLDGNALGWLFNYDITGAVRTGNGVNGWSMGAYEFDGALGADYEPDQYEPDDSFETAAFIELAASQYRSINSDGDIDYIRFTIPADLADLEYTIKISDFIHSFESNLVLFNDDHIAVAYGNTELVTQLQAGDYYIQVSGNTTGKYRVTLQLPPDQFESNNSYTNATPITVNTGMPVALSIHAENDYDYFVFEVDTASYYKFETRDIQYGLNTTVSVSEQESSNSYSSLGGCNSGGANETETLILFLEPGTYYLNIDSYNYDSSGIYTLDVTDVIIPEPDLQESNNDFSEATPLTIATPLAVTLTEDDVDYYTFQVSEQQEYRINLFQVSYNLDVSLEVLDASYNQLGMVNSNGANANEFILLTLVPGTYYIVADNVNNTCGIYSIIFNNSQNQIAEETKTADIGTTTGGIATINFDIPPAAISYTLTLEMRGDLASSSEYGDVTIGSLSLGSFYTGEDGDALITVLTDHDITDCGSPGDTVTLTTDFSSGVNVLYGTMSSYAEVRATINYTY